MRWLTSSEARVICDMLADSAVPERRLIREAGIPRSTYHSIKHRALANGWVRERYVPNLSLLMVTRLRFFLAQPYSERWRDAVRALRENSSTVLLWAWPETLFAVIGERSARVGRDDTAAHELYRQAWSVTEPSGFDGILAYFDHEGSWSTWAEGTKPRSYPRTVPDFRKLSRGRLRTLSKADWAVIRLLVAHPFDSKHGREGTNLYNRWLLSRRQRNLIASGCVSRMVLPSLSEMPPYDRWHPQRVVFVTGLIRVGTDPRMFFTDLSQRMRVYPFLFSHDGSRVLFAGLSPAIGTAPQVDRSTVDLVKHYLEKVAVVREPLDTLFPLIDHRYDRLVSSDITPDRPV